MKFREKILVIEDEPSMAYLTTTILESGGYEVLAAATGKDAELLIPSHCPDLVLLDLGLPDIDGMTILENVRKWSGMPIIVVSARDTEADKVAALNMGADDYISKPFGSSELLARVKVALRHSISSGTNKSINAQCQFRVRDLVIDYPKYRVFIRGKDAGLTVSEFKLVALLGRYAGEVLTYDFIISQLWGPNAVADNQILRVNIANIRRKIEENPASPEYIITKVGLGYKLAEV